MFYICLSFFKRRKKLIIIYWISSHRYLFIIIIFFFYDQVINGNIRRPINGFGPFAKNLSEVIRRFSHPSLALNDIIRLLPGVDYYPCRILELIIVKSLRCFFFCCCCCSVFLYFYNNHCYFVLENILYYPNGNSTNFII